MAAPSGEEDTSHSSSKTTHVETMTVKTNLLTKMLLTANSPSKPDRGRDRGARHAGEKNGAKNARTASVNVLPPCRVCGNPASGFHYGVNSCEACKRFFRRATRRKRNFKCRGQKQCNVRGSERMLCGYCRFMRCLALGMSCSNIKTGRYSHEKRAQDMSEVQKLRIQSFDTLRMSEAEVDDVVQSLMEGQLHMRTNDGIPEDVMRERMLKKHEEFTLLQNMIGPHRLISHAEYADVYEKTGLDVDGRKMRVERWMRSIENCVEGFVKFCKSVPGFSDMSIHDQTNLLKYSRVEVWFLGAYKGFDANLSVIHAPNGNCHHGFEMSQFLGEDYVECAFQLATRLKNLEMTPEETVVVKAVCVMSADRCPLDDGRRVEERHWMLVRCLLHLIDREEREERRSPGMFPRVVSCLVALRNLTDISRRYLNNTLVADAAQDHPMLLELLLG